jgi:hypothetical protein
MHPQKRFQFSLNQMLWGAFGGAVIAAVAAYFAYRMSPAQLRWFAAFLATVAAGFVAGRIYRFRKGQEIARSSGQFISEWAAVVPTIVGRVILLLYLALIVLSEVLSAISTANIHPVAPSANSMSLYWFTVAFSFLVPFMYGGIYGFFFYGGGTLAICENGIVLAERLFIPWADIEWYSWKDSISRRKLRLSLRRCYARSKMPQLHRRKFFRVPAEVRDRFEELLTANSVACDVAIAQV